MRTNLTQILLLSQAQVTQECNVSNESAAYAVVEQDWAGFEKAISNRE